MTTRAIAVALDVTEGRRKDPLTEPIPIQARDAVGSLAEVLGRKVFGSEAVCAVVLDDLDAIPVVLRNRRNPKHPRPWNGTMREISVRWNRVERPIAKT